MHVIGRGTGGAGMVVRGMGRGGAGGDGWTGQGAGGFRATTRVAPAAGDAIAYPQTYI